MRTRGLAEIAAEYETAYREKEAVWLTRLDLINEAICTFVRYREALRDGEVSRAIILAESVTRTDAAAEVAAERWRLLHEECEELAAEMDRCWLR